jgi:protein-tyrosine phosphatase
MDWVDETVAIGNIIDSQNRAELNKNQIDVMLDARGCFRLDIGLLGKDVPEVPVKEKIQREVDVLLALATAKIKVLVYCFQGHDRSPFLIAVYLSKKLGISIDEAYSEVARKHRSTIVHLEWIEYVRFQEDSVCGTPR